MPAAVTAPTASGAGAVCPETRVRALDVLSWPRIEVRRPDIPDTHWGNRPRHDGEAVGSVLARYYDPATGQFLTVDPKVATTLSPYGYVSGNPINETDPAGRCVWIGCWVQQQLNNHGLCTINQSNCGNSLIDSVPGFAGAGSAVYGWESPSSGYDYKTTSFGLPFLSFSITVTKDNSLFFGSPVVSVGS